MNVQAPFGFVTSCHPGDKILVQATLASMRHFCPDVPICLIVDEDFGVGDLVKEYDLILLPIVDLPSTAMKQLMMRNFQAKLAAMWEGPFEQYVFMDSDAIVWGDFTPQVQRDLDFQIFWNEISIPPDAKEIPAWLKHFYFDAERLRQFDPTFDWRGNAYFCGGVYACRRNVLSFEEWVRVRSWGACEPGDQGELNYLVHAKTQRGEIKTAVTDLQHLWAFHGRDELVNDCASAGWHFPKQIRRPRVAHFCYRKPYLFDRKAYSRPFTIARLEHHRRHHGELGAWLAILNEDRRVLTGKVKRQFKHLMNR